jgi:hypothetical protein
VDQRRRLQRVADPFLAHPLCGNGP